MAVNHHAGNLCNALGFSHDGFDFAKFHAVAAHLDHTILSSVKNQAALLVIGHIIARMVQGSLSGMKRIVRKFCCGFLRQVVVANGNIGACHTKFPHCPRRRDSFAIFVNQIHLGTAAGFAQHTVVFPGNPMGKDSRCLG